mmetsp:Transcript_2606/g.6248  ORF Transcript_2606/g.6248 Transcript_2606/m.6248 type:complete len:275 (+) Transcript_2606:285-1109(+)
MPGPQIHLEADWIFLCAFWIRVPEGRGKLGGFPVGDPGIVQAAGQPAAGIGFAVLNGIHGAVIQHVLEVLFLVGISPLDPFAGSQRDGRIHHGANYVHKGNTQNRHLEEFRGLVDRCPHQHAARRSALAGQHLGGRPFLHQKLCNVHKIVKGILFAQILGAIGLLVPLSSHFATPTNVCNDVDHSTFQQWQTGRVKVGLAARTIRAITIQVHGNFFTVLDSFHSVLSINNTDGDLCFAIPRQNFQTITSIQFFLVVWNDLGFQNRAVLIIRARQ